MTWRSTTMGVPWNVFLIALGSVVCMYGAVAVAQPHHFLVGGLFGLCLYLKYVTGWLSPGIWYAIINVPIFLLGWFFVSRRFFIYSLFGVAAIFLAAELITTTFPIHDKMLAAVTGGVLYGAGSGIVLRSLGSCGGLDIISIILFQKWNIRVGQVSFVANMLIFATAFVSMENDLILYSVAMVFVSASVCDYVLSMFNQRKVAFIISDSAETIARTVVKTIQRGGTFLEGTGIYSGKRKQVLMVVVNNYQLKRLEETVFSVDPNAFVIVENTFNVLGEGFSRRKVY
ncbi:YitT family protein [Oceanidesulfovibrio marinus]|uniref:YitT family protein n=1 Tax=Oceanidesulfovibrio marinus TaxID=370038 RepID=A0ABX6NLI2_9BACT|nr:YitT family protein [Oceanidesulfovibrio marinus]QJT10557.1 YitT family protein [Oceanidesulfovibrio marinus]